MMHLKLILKPIILNTPINVYATAFLRTGTYATAYYSKILS
jgi:hypothetical protein